MKHTAGCGFAYVLLFPSIIFAQSSPSPKYPDVYFWNTPSSSAAWDPGHFHPMLRIELAAADNPEQRRARTATFAVNLASQAYDALPPFARQSETKFSVLLQNFGARWHPDSVFFRSDDFVFSGDFGTTVPAWVADPETKNPWMKEGIKHAKDWMADFRDAWVATHAQNSQIPPLPTPTRFDFDTEEFLAVPGWRGFVQLLDAYKNDPKWSQACVPGSGGDTLAAGGKTLAQLWADAKNSFSTTPSNPLLPWASSSPILTTDFGFGIRDASSEIYNQDIYMWWSSVCQKALDGAMKQAAYDVLRAPLVTNGGTNLLASAKFSNYGDVNMTPGIVDFGTYQRLTSDSIYAYPFFPPGVDEAWAFTTSDRGQPDWLQHGHHLIDLTPQTSRNWLVQRSMKRSGDFNTPVLYAVGAYNPSWTTVPNSWQYYKERNPYKATRPDDEKWLDVTSRHHRRLLDSIVATEVEANAANSSFAPGSTISPWIALPGSNAQSFQGDAKDASLGGCAIVSRVLPLLRSKGVTQFMVWDDVPVASRNDKVVEFKDWYHATYDPYFTYAKIVDSGMLYIDETDWSTPIPGLIPYGSFRASRIEDTLPRKQSNQWLPYTLQLSPRYTLLQYNTPNVPGQWIPAMFEVGVAGLPIPNQTQFQSQPDPWDGTVSFFIEGWANGSASELDDLHIKVNLWNFVGGLEGGWTPLEDIDFTAYAEDQDPYGGIGLWAPTRDANNQVTSGAGRRDFRRELRVKLPSESAAFINADGQMRIQVTAQCYTPVDYVRHGFDSISFDLLQVVPVVGTCPVRGEGGFQQLASQPPTSGGPFAKADFDQDSKVDTNDIELFFDAYDLAIPHADQNADGQVDVADVVQFITDYANTGGN